MKRLLLLSLLFTSVALAQAGCTDDGGEAPDSVRCDDTKKVTNKKALLEAIDEEDDKNTCIIVENDITVDQAITVRPDIFLVGPHDHQPTLTIAGSITLGQKSQLGNLIIKPTHAGAGVVVTTSDVRVFDVVVTGAKATALAIACTDPAVCSAAPIKLERVTLEKSAVGLTVYGPSTVTMTGGSVASNGGTSLSGGMGVVVSNGANVTIDGARIENNEGAGIVIDGATTKAVIKSSQITNNTARGVWAQGLEGTLDAPALRIEATEITKNKITGMGAVSSRGIIIVGGRVADTALGSASTTIATTEPLGDGIGIFANSSDFKIDQTTVVEGNARAAGIVDGNERGIIIVGGRVSAGASGLKFVVQNNPQAQITIDDRDKSTPEKPLAVSAPKLTLPGAPSN
jgi:hypothetical protein